MCEMCEHQFDVMSQLFDEFFAEYLRGHNDGLTRDTPAKRVHDLAFEHQGLCETKKGMTFTSWFLAIALERLTALEAAGVPT